jgi:hypothetical protein
MTTNTRPSKVRQRQPSKAPTAGVTRRLRPVLWIVVALIAANLIVYAGVQQHDFLKYDDELYVTENPVVPAGLTWRGVAWAFTTGHASNWHPLTWLSHMLDVQLYGMHAAGHHLTNLFLHVLNTLLLFGVLHRTTGAVGRSGFVAALFAVHPLHVESVAWVAERKDVLSTLFWMLTLWSYVSYVRQPRQGRYGLVIVLYAVGLLAKPMLVTLPFVLLLLDYWPLGRVTRESTPRAHAEMTRAAQQRSLWLHLVREKLPLFALAAASSIVTFVAQQRGGSVISLDQAPLPLRAANALVSYVTYIVKMLWPVRLAVLYPFPASFAAWQVIGAAVILIAVSSVAVRVARRHAYVFVGWFWYVGTLVPVIGLVQVGGQAMADRYTYIPLVGLFVIAAWGVPALLDGPSIASSAVDPSASALTGRSEVERRQRIALAIAAGIVITLFTAVARNQVQYWTSTIPLWEHTLQVTHKNAIAHDNLGNVLAGTGRFGEAVPHLSEAVRLDPRNAGAHNDLGVALIQQGKRSEAVAQFAEAVRLRPGFALARHNLAMALARQGKLTAAIPEMLEAVRIWPENAAFRVHLAGLYQRTGETAQAVRQLEEALTLNPNDQTARHTLDELQPRAPR